MLKSEKRVRNSSPKGPSKSPVHNRLLSRLLLFFITLTMCFNMAIPAEAYSLVHIQCSIDLATWEILTAVVRDEIGLTSASPEYRRISEDNLEMLKEATSLGALADEISGLSDAVENRDKKLAHGDGFFAGIGQGVTGAAQNLGIGEEKNRVLSFPTDQDKRKDSTSVDMENALNANNSIVFDLNHAFNAYCETNNITKTDDANAFLSTMVSFLKSLPTPIGNYVTYNDTQYQWKVEKYPDSSEYITWDMLIYEAFSNYSLEGEESVTSETVYSSNPNQLTKALVGFLGGALDSLRSILGLWSMDELFFNEGWREMGYVGGIFPTNWEPTIWGLFFFMEILAAMVLLFGVLNNVLRKAMSTINTIERMHAMKQIQDLLVCAVALALLPLCLRMVISLAGDFVNIVHDIVPEGKTISSMVARFASGSGTIGGVIAQFLYFGVQVYFNFYYALRALSVAILVIIAPLMIAMISVSNARKQLTMQWFKELLSNILIQPIHAFCITTILLLPTSTHAFDNLIALYALIPFTSMMKGLFFGSAGSWSDQSAQRARGALTGTMKSAAIGAGSALIGGVAGIAGSKLAGRAGGGASGESGGADAAAPDLSQKKGIKGALATGLSAVEDGANQIKSDYREARENGLSRSEAANEASVLAMKGAGSSLCSVVGSSMDSAKEAVSHPVKTGKAALGAGKQLAVSGANCLGRAAYKGARGAIAGTGKVVKNLPRVAAGSALGAAGGILSSSGVGGMMGGRALTTAGQSLIAGNGLGRREPQNQELSSNNGQNNMQQGNTEMTNSSPEPSQADLPVTLGGGTQKANEILRDGTEMSVQDFDEKALNQMGISDVDDQKRFLEFSMAEGASQANEMGQYADYLQTLSPQDRKTETDKRGIIATRTADGVAVRINKGQWAKVNQGATINANTNKRTGETSLRVKTPVGADPVSFTGGVTPPSVSIASVPTTSQVELKSGGAVPIQQESVAKYVNSGMTEQEAIETAAIDSSSAQYREMGMPDGDAWNMASEDVRGNIAKAETIIPTETLSGAQQQIMETAGTKRTQAGYVVPYGQESVRSPQQISFTSYMKQRDSKPQAPTPPAGPPAGTGRPVNPQPAPSSVPEQVPEIKPEAEDWKRQAEEAGIGEQ